MPAALLLMFALQGRPAQVGPPSLAGANPFGCPVLALTGRLVFPAYVPPWNFVSVELHSLETGGTRETMTGPYNQFMFMSLSSGTYEIVLQPPGMDVVRQLVVLTRDECLPNPGVRVEVPLRISPAIKPSPISEDVIAIESLIRETPHDAVKIVEKSLQRDAQANTPELSPTLENVLKTAPDYYDANLELGLEYKKANRRPDAIRALTHALEVNSASMLARAALGEYSFDAGDFQKAVTLLSEAARLGSTSPDVYFMLGASYYKLHELDLAEASLLRALEINPTIGKARLSLYNVYMARRMPEKALKEADAYLEKYPDAEDREYVRLMADKLRRTLKPDR